MTKPYTDADSREHGKKQSKSGHEKDPRAELGLKDPGGDQQRQENDKDRTAAEAQGQKATRFDGNPNPTGAESSVLRPKDDTPIRLKKNEGPRNDQ